MVFGSCCYLKNDKLSGMKAKSVKITGEQVGLIVNFEVTQSFIHSESEPKEIHYVFPNDLKICIYDTTFVVGDEVIKPKLQSKEEAQKTYKEAVDEGRTAVFGSNIDHGMTEFKLGNLPPETECKVILNIAFTAQITKENQFFIKFPLDVYTPGGSTGCLDVESSDFQFKLQCDKRNISKVTSNVKNCKFNENEKAITISQKVENESNQRSIILNFESNEPIKNSILIGTTINNYSNCVITISPNLSPTTDLNKEFLFLVDCSGSMRGDSIKKAGECLEIFIRSLPSESYFNIIQFGTRFESLFENSVKYDEETSEKGIRLAQSLAANFGGTNIFTPLENAYKKPNEHGQRQVFILTDGEVSNVESVLDLIASNSSKNRCFTIGIGRGCDAGLVEGMAAASGGKSDFVQEGDSISEKVIPQLKSSIHPSLTSIEVHVPGEGSDAFEVSPFPIPTVNANGSTVIYLRQKRGDQISFENGILISGNYGDETIEIPIDEVLKVDSIGKAVLPLFAFNILKSYERRTRILDDDKLKAIELSISSGVLCKFTGYVGMTESSVNRHHVVRRIAAPGCYITMECPRGGPPARMTRGSAMKCCSKKAKKHVGLAVDDEDDIVNLQRPPPPPREMKQPDSKPKPNQFDLMKLIRCQKINGYWEDLNEVNKLAGVNVNHIDEINLDDKSEETKCLATIVAIAALHVNSLDQKNVWTMIEEKAMTWLKATLTNIDIDPIIQKIESLIKNAELETK
ncbi:von Willebrand factor A domain-containing protein 5A [Tritrichomonas musculus]|uniref:von Willebrand factor A domain-containing protein 5A n=1 Tax=Tritrichomonas musculus TaxID=1915356 RepID=A0ABR2GL06_9EUKA